MKKQKEALAKAECCQGCGETHFSPSIEAFEMSELVLCDTCAEDVFEENEQFGVGA